MVYINITMAFVRLNALCYNLTMKTDMSLRPTLWRTVRAVMNEHRLRLLRDVFAHDGEFCIRQIAGRAGLDEPIASIYLRQMNARGLLGVRRDRIKVFYNTEPDRSLPESVSFQAALRKCISGRQTKGWELKLMTVLRGFSHFNRLAVLLRLAQGPARYDELVDAMGVCVKSFYHHLHYLRCADLVTTDSIGRERVFVLVQPSHPVAVCLMKLLLSDRYASAAYYNPGSGRKTDRAEKTVMKRISAHEGNSRDRWQEKKTMKSRSRPLQRETRDALAEPDMT